MKNTRTFFLISTFLYQCFCADNDTQLKVEMVTKNCNRCSPRILDNLNKLPIRIPSDKIPDILVYSFQNWEIESDDPPSLFTPPLEFTYPHNAQDLPIYKKIVDRRSLNLFLLVYKRKSFGPLIEIQEETYLAEKPPSIPRYQRSSISSTITIGRYLVLQFLCVNFSNRSPNLKEISEIFSNMHKKLINKSPSHILFLLGSFDTLTIPQEIDYPALALETSEINMLLYKQNFDETLQNQQKTMLLDKFNQLRDSHPIEEVLGRFYKFIHNHDLYTRLIKLKFLLEYCKEDVPLFKPTRLLLTESGENDPDIYPLMSYQDKILRCSFSPLSTLGLRIERYDSLEDNERGLARADNSTVFLLGEINMNLYNNGEIIYDRIKNKRRVKLNLNLNAHAKELLQSYELGRNERFSINLRGAVRDYIFKFLFLNAEHYMEDAMLEFYVEGIVLCNSFNKKRSSLEFILVFKKTGSAGKGWDKLFSARLKCFIRGDLTIGAQGQNRKCLVFNEDSGRSLGEMLIWL